MERQKRLVCLEARNKSLSSLAFTARVRLSMRRQRATEGGNGKSLLLVFIQVTITLLLLFALPGLKRMDDYYQTVTFLRVAS